MYVTDSLQAAPQAKYIPWRWIEKAEPKQQKAEEVSAEQILRDTIKGAGLVVV
jgi:hypothetical protein